MSEPEVRLCTAEKAEGNVKTTKRDLSLFAVRSTISSIEKQIELAASISTTAGTSDALRTRMTRKSSQLLIQLSREKRLQSRLRCKHVPESYDAAFEVLTAFISYPHLCGLPLYFLETLVELATEAQKYATPTQQQQELSELSGKPVPPAPEIKSLLIAEIDSFDRAHAIIKCIQLGAPSDDEASGESEESSSKKRKQ